MLMPGLRVVQLVACLCVCVVVAFLLLCPVAAAQLSVSMARPNYFNLHKIKVYPWKMDVKRKH